MGLRLDSFKRSKAFFTMHTPPYFYHLISQPHKMSDKAQDENQAPLTGQKRPNGLELGPRKKVYVHNVDQECIALTPVL